MNETNNNIILPGDAGRGVTRRDALRTLVAGGMLATTAGGLLTHTGAALAATPKKGGRIRVAVGAGSTADTLDPARGSNIADFVRHFMFYNCLTTIDDKLAPQMELAESITTKDAVTWTMFRWLQDEAALGIVAAAAGEATPPSELLLILIRHELRMREGRD